MAGFPLELPTIQNWSCHSCSGCCRQHAITVTQEEKKRIEQQNWQPEDGIPAEQPLFKKTGWLPGKTVWRLTHQSDGACIFLNEQGLCRIHAKFGEQAKPLACRIYPFTFHPKGKRLSVSLRFSCPSVVENLGQPVTRQKSDLQKLSRLVVPEQALQAEPPPINSNSRVAWDDLLLILDALGTTLSEQSVPLVIRLLRALNWIDLLDQADLKNFSGHRFQELLELLAGSSLAEIPDQFDLASVPAPSRLGRIQFRQLVSYYAREDNAAQDHGTLRTRWFLFKSAIRFVRGQGNIPPLQECFRSLPFQQIEQISGAIPDPAEEILTRYFLVKIQGLHFCGRAYYGIPFVEGIHSLILMFPVVLWLARWLAASSGRDVLQPEDISRALSIADHHHGFSPALGSFFARRRVKSLSHTRDLERLCSWYARI